MNQHATNQTNKQKKKNQGNIIQNTQRHSDTRLFSHKNPIKIQTRNQTIIHTQRTCIVKKKKTIKTSLAKHYDTKNIEFVFVLATNCWAWCLPLVGVCIPSEIPLEKLILHLQVVNRLTIAFGLWMATFVYFLSLCCNPICTIPVQVL